MLGKWGGFIGGKITIVRGDTFDYHLRYENNFLISMWEELNATFGVKVLDYQNE
jgi:hypothetical protein